MKGIGHVQVMENQAGVTSQAKRSDPKQSWLRWTLATTALVSGFSCSASGVSFGSYQVPVTTQAQGNATIRHGILLLAVPTLVLFALIVAFVYKRRNVSR